MGRPRAAKEKGKGGEGGKEDLTGGEGRAQHTSTQILNTPQVRSMERHHKLEEKDTPACVSALHQPKHTSPRG